MPITNKSSDYIYIYIYLYIYKTTLSYCLKCRKNPKSKNSKVLRTENGRIKLLSNYAVCNIKKSTFIKGQEAKGLLISIGIRTPLIKILFCFKV